jgi:BMFP domain-containing protein YqiC
VNIPESIKPLIAELNRTLDENAQGLKFGISALVARVAQLERKDADAQGELVSLRNRVADLEGRLAVRRAVHPGTEVVP